MRQIFLIFIFGVTYSIYAQTLSSGELTTMQKNDSKNYWLSYYSNNITFLDEATYEYNCHAYAWHISEAGTHVWLNDPGDDEFWNDDSYYQVYSETEDLKVSFGK